MEFPQEIETWYTLPAVRRELARLLVEAGFTQRLVAKKLNVTEAAVSQYLSNKRGITITYPADITAALKTATAKIQKTDDIAVVRKEILKLSKLMKDNKVICELHKKHGGVKDNCSMCFE